MGNRSRFRAKSSAFTTEPDPSSTPVESPQSPPATTPNGTDWSQYLMPLGGILVLVFLIIMIIMLITMIILVTKISRL